MKDLLLKQELGRGGKGIKGGKRKRAAAEEAKAAGEDDFSLDVQDSRFGSIYTSSDFAIDPTDPKYRPTKGSEQLRDEVQKRHGKHATAGERGGGDADDGPSAAANGAASGAAGGAGDAGGVLARLVSSVKAKAKLGAGAKRAKK